MAVDARIRLGQTPPVWRRSVIFFSNLLSIFYENTAQTQYLSERVGGLNTYANRMLPVVKLLYGGSHDLLLVEQAPAEILKAYFANELKLDLPEVRVFSERNYQRLAHGEPIPADSPLHGLREHPADCIDGFVTDKNLAMLGEVLGKSTLSSYQGSLRGNNKLLLHQATERLGFPVFDMELVDQHAGLGTAFRELKSRGYERVVVKSQVGASGIGMIKLPADGNGEEVPRCFFHDGPVLVQGWLEPGVRGVEAVRSPSVQMCLREEELVLYDTTDQILSKDSVHQGNAAPSSSLTEEPGLLDRVLEMAACAGQWLHEQGYRGTASADFLVTKRASGPVPYLCEINARVTGATYPALLAGHFVPEGAWLMRNVRFGETMDGSRIMSVLRREGLLFESGMKRGVLPINFNEKTDGSVLKAQLLCLAGSPSGCQQEMALVESVFRNGTDYDRD